MKRSLVKITASIIFMTKFMVTIPYTHSDKFVITKVTDRQINNAIRVPCAFATKSDFHV